MPQLAQVNEKNETDISQVSKSLLKQSVNQVARTTC